MSRRMITTADVLKPMPMQVSVVGKWHLPWAMNYFEVAAFLAALVSVLVAP